MDDAAARHLSVVPVGKPVKLVVWDLDDTLWDGTLLEDAEVRLRPGVEETLRRLDAWGVLNSIASRNDPAAAMAMLRRLGLADYFLCPEIGWCAKSASVQAIATRLNIAADAILFVDDQAFERAEVSDRLPDVRVVDAVAPERLLSDPMIVPAVVTDEARRRRLAYQEEQARDAYEAAFEGPSEAFLHTLRMQLTLSLARPEDLHRAEELVTRTNQLNSTGTIFSFADLERLSADPRYLLVIAELHDRFGAYGKIGVALVQRRAHAWRLKLLLVSCRVLSRGIGPVLLNHLMARAQAEGADFEAELRDTGRNRPMQITYKFAGFREVAREGDVKVMRRDGGPPPGPPAYLELVDAISPAVQAQM
jgi:FkbH-like protein